MVSPFTEHKWKSACGKPLKAITPVIATVMLMLITVGMVGMTYTWFSNMMTTQTEKNIAIPIGGVQCINNRISAIVTNTGANSNITDDDIVVADVNGVSVRNTPFFGGFNTNGLVGYWRFEQSSGSAATNDSSGYGNMGTLTNMNLVGDATSGPTQGRFGNALLFDGVDDFVSVADSSNLDITTNITISTWAYLSSFKQSNILEKGGCDGYFFLVRSTGNIEFGKQCDAGSNTVASGLSAGKWYHVVGVKQGTTGTIYINGAQAGQDTSFADFGDVGSLSIGKGTTGDGNFNGTIDEVMIWNRSLTADEVTQLNKTSAANFTLAPNKAVTLIKGYTVFAKGKYTVRVGTRNGVIARTVECL